MDACVMTAQLLAQCMTGTLAVALEPESSPPATNPTARTAVPPVSTTVAQPSPEPRTVTPVRGASQTTELSPTLDCEAWGSAAKPKLEVDGGDGIYCAAASPNLSNPSNPSTVPPVAMGLPLSLPLHGVSPRPPRALALTPAPVPPTPDRAGVASVVRALPSPTARPSPPSSSPLAVRPLTPSPPVPETMSEGRRVPGRQPVNGSQLYALRRAALQAGQMYNRTSPQRYWSQWGSATVTPTHQDWQALLQREATVMAQAQGRNRLTVVVGDSLALWMPSETLPQNRFWLNQGISGETTTHMLSRLHYFAHTRPDTIHILAGINDLRQGATEDTVVRNLRQMVVRLKQQHPQARIVLHSILPTRWESLSSSRIQRVNGNLADVAQQQGVTFVDWRASFTDAQGRLRRDLTTDGLHLSYQGYRVWQSALVSY